MEAMQRQVLKLFRKDRSSPSSPEDTGPDSGAWLKRRRKPPGSTSSSSTVVQDGNESDSAKYWTSAKTRRKLKHLGARELPPLPPGAIAGTPDIFRHSPVRFGRGVESPAHIYEEIPSWALDVTLDVAGHDQGSAGSTASEAQHLPLAGETSPVLSQAETTRIRALCTQRRSASGDLPNSGLLRTHRQCPSSHAAPTQPPHSYAEISVPSVCSSVPGQQHSQSEVDLLNIPLVTAKTAQAIEDQRRYNFSKISRSHLPKGPARPVHNTPGPAHRDNHHLPKTMPPANNTQLDNVRQLGVDPLQDLDQLDIPVQEIHDFLSSSRDNLCEADDPTQVYKVKRTREGMPLTQHVHDDSIDGCYEYDISSPPGQKPSDAHSKNRHKHTRSTSGASGSTRTKDPFRSCDKGSFRSCDGSHGKSESSNDTFSEYDIKSDSSAYDCEGDYEHILSKIRDNLRLKENVQKLACEGSQQSMSASDSTTLTSVSSLSEISTLADEEIRRLLVSSKSSLATSQYSLVSENSKLTAPQDSSSDETPKADDDPQELCLTSAKEEPSVPCAGARSLSTSKVPEVTRIIPVEDDPPRRRASTSCVTRDTEGRLSCRVSNLKAETLQKTKKKPVKVARRPSGQSNPRSYSMGNNRLLADIMQRNHDRQTLFL